MVANIFIKSLCWAKHHIGMKLLGQIPLSNTLEDKSNNEDNNHSVFAHVMMT
jgi:hypothetical protein